MIEIIDIISLCKGKYSNKPYGCLYVIADRLPIWRYKRYGSYLIAEDSGFYTFLGEDPGTTKAFGGAKFDIHMYNGDIIKAHGQFWACGVPKSIEPEPNTECGISTIQVLQKCYVFDSAQISIAKLEEWLSTHKTHEDYYKYNFKNKPLLRHIENIEERLTKLV